MLALYPVKYRAQELELPEIKIPEVNLLEILAKIDVSKILEEIKIGRDKVDKKSTCTII